MNHYLSATVLIRDVGTSTPPRERVIAIEFRVVHIGTNRGIQPARDAA